MPSEDGAFQQWLRFSERIRSPSETLINLSIMLNTLPPPPETLHEPLSLAILHTPGLVIKLLQKGWFTLTLRDWALVLDRVVQDRLVYPGSITTWHRLVEWIKDHPTHSVPLRDVYSNLLQAIYRLDNGFGAKAEPYKNAAIDLAEDMRHHAFTFQEAKDIVLYTLNPLISHAHEAEPEAGESYLQYLFRIYHPPAQTYPEPPINFIRLPSPEQRDHERAPAARSNTAVPITMSRPSGYGPPLVVIGVSVLGLAAAGVIGYGIYKANRQSEHSKKGRDKSVGGNVMSRNTHVKARKSRNR